MNHDNPWSQDKKHRCYSWHNKGSQCKVLCGENRVEVRRRELADQKRPHSVQEMEVARTQKTGVVAMETKVCRYSFICRIPESLASNCSSSQSQMCRPKAASHPAVFLKAFGKKANQRVGGKYLSRSFQ